MAFIKGSDDELMANRARKSKSNERVGCARGPVRQSSTEPGAGDVQPAKKRKEPGGFFAGVPADFDPGCDIPWRIWSYWGRLCAMPESESAAGPDDARLPEDFAEAGTYATVGEGFDHGLVVLAMGLPYCLLPVDGGYQLLVELVQLAAVREQLARFDRESVGWPPRPVLPEPATHHLAPGGPLIWAVGVASVFWAQREWPDSLEAAGELEPQALFAGGEWWGPLTALFLHGDLAHLLSNLLTGTLVFAVVGATFGRRQGWLLLALAAVAANTAVAALSFPGPYRSIGASTAVFAGLGLLTGGAVRVAWRSAPPRRWRAVFVPLAAGLTLLGLHGAGGMRTDVAAHVAGFGAGFVAGLVTGIRRRPG